MQGSIPGLSHEKGGAVDGGVVPVVVVVDDVDDVVAPLVDVIVLVVLTVVEVEVVGVGLLQSNRQVRARLCCLRGLILPQPAHSPRSRRFSLRQAFLRIWRVCLQARTQPRMIVHRPPPVDRHFGRSEILEMQSA